MKITPTTLTISQLFSSSNEQFFIPAYQRRYSWQWKQIAELFDDINLLKANDTHLLGSIVREIAFKKFNLSSCKLA